MGRCRKAEVEDKLLAFLRDHIEGCEEAKLTTTGWGI